MYLHSLTSALLFLLVGWFVDVYQTRVLNELSLWHQTSMRLILLVLLLANGGFPWFGLFWSEAQLLTTTLHGHSPLLTLLLAIASLLALLSGLVLFTAQTRESLTGYRRNSNALVYASLFVLLLLLVQAVDVLGL